MRKEEIHLIQGEAIYSATIIIDLDTEATETVQKPNITNIIHHGKDNA